VQIARKTRVMAQFAIPLLFAAIALPAIGRMYLALLEPSGAGAPAVNAVIHLINAAPALLLAWAVVSAERVLAEHEAGRFLSLAASRQFKRASESALAALALHLIVAPLLVALLRGAPLLEALRFDAFDLAVMMFASFMLAIGGLFESAAQGLKADNDQFI